MCPKRGGANEMRRPGVHVCMYAFGGLMCMCVYMHSDTLPNTQGSLITFVFPRKWTGDDSRKDFIGSP